MEDPPKGSIQKLYGCWLAGIIACLWVAMGIDQLLEGPGSLLPIMALGIISGGLGYAMTGAYKKGFADGLESAKDSASEPSA